MNKKSRAQKLQSRIDRLKSYQQTAGCPTNDEEITELKSNFKLDKYFDIFDKIDIEAGWAIDYLYQGSHLGAAPRIIVYREDKKEEYSKKAFELSSMEEDEMSFRREVYEADELKKFLNSPDLDENYLNHIKLDGSKESYFQFIILLSMASQFALFWHAATYDAEIVCTTEAVKKILARKDSGNGEYYTIFSDEEKVAKAKELNVEPEIEIKQDKVLIRLVSFTKWGGFFEIKYQIRKDFPHQIIDREKKNLLHFECGFVY